jgi:hypothetical protein
MMVVVVFMWVCKGRTITSISAVVGARQIVERASERAYITSWWEGRIVNGVRISAATEQPRVRADEGGGGRRRPLASDRTGRETILFER